MAVFIEFMRASASPGTALIGMYCNFPAATTVAVAALWTLGPSGLHSKHGLSEAELERDNMVDVLGGQDGFFGMHKRCLLVTPGTTGEEIG